MLTLSHGNAAIERGFSINKECLIDNLSNESLVAQRQVYEGLVHEGGIKNIQITKEMILFTRNSRSKYHEALDMKNKANKAITEAKVAKKRAAEKLKEANAKRQKMLEESQRKLQEANLEVLAAEAELRLAN